VRNEFVQCLYNNDFDNSESELGLIFRPKPKPITFTKIPVINVKPARPTENPRKSIIGAALAASIAKKNPDVKTVNVTTAESNIQEKHSILSSASGQFSISSPSVTSNLINQIENRENISEPAANSIVQEKLVQAVQEKKAEVKSQEKAQEGNKLGVGIGIAAAAIGAYFLLGD
jgi:hypothetical protein